MQPYHRDPVLALLLSVGITNKVKKLRPAVIAQFQYAGWAVPKQAHALEKLSVRAIGSFDHSSASLAAMGGCSQIAAIWHPI